MLREKMYYKIVFNTNKLFFYIYIYLKKRNMLTLEKQNGKTEHKC